MFGVSAFAQSPFASLANKTFADTVTENIGVAATPAQIVAYTTMIVEPISVFSSDNTSTSNFVSIFETVTMADANTQQSAFGQVITEPITMA